MIHIRQILHRASLLIAVFAAVAAMVALCFTTVAQFYIMEAVDPDFLSDNSVKVEIHQSNVGEPLVQTRDLCEYYSLQGGSLIVYRSYPIANGKAVFLSADTAFRPEIIEVRSFSKDDFEQQAAVWHLSMKESVTDALREMGSFIFCMKVMNTRSSVSLKPKLPDNTGGGAILPAHYTM